MPLDVAVPAEMLFPLCRSSPASLVPLETRNVKSYHRQGYVLGPSPISLDVHDFHPLLRPCLRTELEECPAKTRALES